MQLIGSIILCYKGRNGNAKRIGDRPDQKIQLSANRPSRDAVHTNFVDARLDDRIGDRIKNRLNPDRQTESKNILPMIFIQSKLLPMNLTRQTRFQ